MIKSKHLGLGLSICRFTRSSRLCRSARSRSRMGPVAPEPNSWAEVLQKMSPEEFAELEN